MKIHIDIFVLKSSSVLY